VKPKELKRPKKKKKVIRNKKENENKRRKKNIPASVRRETGKPKKKINNVKIKN